VKAKDAAANLSEASTATTTTKPSAATNLIEMQQLHLHQLFYHGRFNRPLQLQCL
jgi:hypothetical protein